MKSGDMLIRAIEWRNKCLNWLQAMSTVEYSYFDCLNYVRTNKN